MLIIAKICVYLRENTREILAKTTNTREILAENSRKKRGILTENGCKTREILAKNLNIMNISPAIKKTEVTKNGKVNIKIRISHKGASRFIATEFYVDPSHFKESGTVSSIHPNSSFINLELKQILLAYERKLISVDTQNYSIGRIVELLTEKAAINDFFSFYEKFIAEKKLVNIRTSEIHQATLNKIKKFDQRLPLMFEDINAGWLKKFENFMTVEGAKVNAAAIHFRNIRTVFNSAIDNEIINLNIYPFRRFKIKSAETEKRSITIDQLKAIRDFETNWEITALARDFFMLSFYLIGTNNADLYNLKTMNAGRITYSRAKTHRKYSIKVEPEAELLIKKLQGENKLIMVSEHYDTVHKMTHQLNKALKRIMPDLTMYHARHTWATIAKNKCRASEEDIAAALGHSRKTVTQIYINRDPSIVDRLNREVIDCLK